MGIWGGFVQGPAPAAPQRQLMPARLMNLLINPFARARDISGDTGGAVYLSGGDVLLNGPLKGAGPPQWPLIEFAPLGALKTGRSRILLPEDFVLLNYWASSSVTDHGGFRVMIYDVNRRMPLTIRPADFNTVAGQGNAPLFLRRPYPFGKSVNNSPPQAKITIVNLETVNNTIQFGFYGVIAPGYVQP